MAWTPEELFYPQDVGTWIDFSDASKLLKSDNNPVTTTGDRIQTAVGKFGKGTKAFDLVQTTSTAQFQWNTSGVAVVDSTANSWYDSGKVRFGKTGLSWKSGEPFTFAATYQRPGTNAAIGPIIARSAGTAATANLQVYNFSSTTPDLRCIANGTVTNFAAATEDEPFVIIITWDGTTARYRVRDSVTTITVGATAEQFTQRILLGARNNGSGNTLWLPANTELKDWFLIDRKLTTLEEDALANYLAGRVSVSAGTAYPDYFVHDNTKSSSSVTAQLIVQRTVTSDVKVTSSVTSDPVTFPATITDNIKVESIVAPNQSFLNNTITDDVKTTSTITASSGITIESPADRGNLKLSLCSVTGEGDNAIIDLHFRVIPNEFSGTDINYSFYGKISGVNGIRPTFRIRVSELYNGTTDTTERYVYTYNIDDYDSNNSFTYFDTRTAGAGYVDVRSNTPFTQDTIHIGRMFLWPVGKTVQWLRNRVIGSPYVSSPPSTIPFGSDYICGYSENRVREDSSPIPNQPIYALKITDPNDMPANGERKRTMFMGSCTHPGEDWCTECQVGFMNLAFGSDPKAVKLRKNFEIFYYPLTNPSGRYGGHYRADFDSVNPTYDANRHWNDSSLTSTTLIKNALNTDLQGKPLDVWLDWHGRIGQGLEDLVSTYDSVQLVTWDRVRDQYFPSAADDPSTVLNGGAWYGATQKGAKLAITPEASFQNRPTQQQMRDWGAVHLKTLSDLYDLGYLTDPVVNNNIKTSSIVTASGATTVVISQGALIPSTQTVNVVGSLSVARSDRIHTSNVINLMQSLTCQSISNNPLSGTILVVNHLSVSRSDRPHISNVTTLRQIVSCSLSVVSPQSRTISINNNNTVTVSRSDRLHTGNVTTLQQNVDCSSSSVTPQSRAVSISAKIVVSQGSVVVSSRTINFISTTTIPVQQSANSPVSGDVFIGQQGSVLVQQSSTTPVSNVINIFEVASVSIIRGAVAPMSNDIDFVASKVVPITRATQTPISFSIVFKQGDGNVYENVRKVKGKLRKSVVGRFV